MPQFVVQKAASFRIDEIYRYSKEQWGEEAAKNYINGMFESFSAIGSNLVFSRPIPSEFGVSGFFYRYEKHFVYWKYLKSGQIGIVTILHQKMHQIKQFKDLPDN